MVKPSIRAGQRRSTISLRTTRGRVGSISVVSAESAATPTVAARRINFRLVVGRRGNRFQALHCEIVRHEVILFLFQSNSTSPIRDRTGRPKPLTTKDTKDHERVHPCISFA